MASLDLEICLTERLVIFDENKLIKIQHRERERERIGFS